MKIIKKFEDSGVINLPEVTIKETPQQKKARLGRSWFKDRTLVAHNFYDEFANTEEAKALHEKYNLDWFLDEATDEQREAVRNEYDELYNKWFNSPEVQQRFNESYAPYKDAAERVSVMENSSLNDEVPYDEKTIAKSLKRFKRWKFWRGLRMGIPKFLRSRKDVKNALQTPYTHSEQSNNYGRWDHKNNVVEFGDQIRPNTPGHEYSHIIYGVTDLVGDNDYYSKGVSNEYDTYNEDYYKLTTDPKVGHPNFTSQMLAGTSPRTDMSTEQYARFIQFCLDNHINPLRRHYSDRRLNRMRQKILNGEMQDNQLFSRYSNEYLKNMFKNWFRNGGKLTNIIK